MKNQELKLIFERIGDALEFKGENPFKIIAYRKAARALGDLTEDIVKIWKEKRIREIPGVGEGIAKKIDEYLRTGKMHKYEEAMQGISEEILSLLGVQGLGPRTLRLAWDKLKVRTRKDLKRVIDDSSLANLPGMGEKKVENIKKGLSVFESGEKRISIGIALPLVDNILRYLRKFGEGKFSYCGSLRRMKETIGDIDILATAKKGKELIDYFTKFPDTERVLAKGETKSSITMKQGHYQIDLRVVAKESYGAALQYFTGSKAHNIHLRKIAREKGLKINEYGVFRGSKKLAGKTEEDVYKVIGFPYIPPELREDRGELEAALKGNLPKLVDYNDIKGDLHIHSNYSDGIHSIKEIALFAKKLGYEYISICDHSKSARYAHGIDEETLFKRNEKIKRVEKEVGIRIFKGIELEILRDGRLDFSDTVLKKLDCVVAAVHSFSKQDFTLPIINACKNPYVHIIAHPTGRLISRREGYNINLDKIMRVAKETGTALEINAYYDRLDLSDINARKAKELGIKISIGSDAHNIGMLKGMRFGVGVARRAWLEKEDVINTLSLKEVENWLKPEVGR